MKMTTYIAGCFVSVMFFSLSVFAQDPGPTKGAIPRPTQIPISKEAPVATDRSDKQPKLAPDYAPVEVDSSKYQLLRVRIHNKGTTDVKPGTRVTAALSIIDVESKPMKGVQCVGITKFFTVFGRPTQYIDPVATSAACFVTRVHVIAPIKPGESGWVIANFAWMGTDFEKVRGVVDRHIVSASDNKMFGRRFGVVMSVEGARNDYVTELNKNFWIK